MQQLVLFFFHVDVLPISFFWCLNNAATSFFSQRFLYLGIYIAVLCAFPAINCDTCFYLFSPISLYWKVKVSQIYYVYHLASQTFKRDTTCFFSPYFLIRLLLSQNDINLADFYSSYLKPNKPS